MSRFTTKRFKDLVTPAMRSVPAISAQEAHPLSQTLDHVLADLRDGTAPAKTGATLE